MVDSNEMQIISIDITIIVIVSLVISTPNFEQSNQSPDSYELTHPKSTVSPNHIDSFISPIPSIFVISHLICTPNHESHPPKPNSVSLYYQPNPITIYSISNNCLSIPNLQQPISINCNSISSTHSVVYSIIQSFYPSH